MGKAYVGKRDGDGFTASVMVVTGGEEDRPLPMRLDLTVCSPNGFSWGYGGCGPEHLALALLADYLGDDARAKALCYYFKVSVISVLPWECWTLTSAEIDEAIHTIERRREQGMPPSRDPVLARAQDEAIRRRFPDAEELRAVLTASARPSSSWRWPWRWIWSWF